MRTLLTIILLVALAGSVRADDKTGIAALDRFLAAGQEMAEVLKGVKDKATAIAVRDKVVKLHDTMGAARKDLPKFEPTAAEKKVLDERIQKAMTPFDEQFARLSLVPDAFAVFADIEVFQMEAELYELRARMTAVKIDLTVSLHKIEHGQYPADLKAAFQKIKRDPPKDPWGREYQYDSTGKRSKAADPKSQSADVWVVSPYGDGKKLLGSWDESKK